MKHLLLALLLLCKFAAPADARQPGAGIWALQPPPKDGKGRIITEAMLKHPKVEGLVIRFHTYDVYNEKTGQFNWKWLDEQVNRARKTGDKFGLLLMGEDYAKPWLNPFAAKYNTVTKALGVKYPDCSAWFPGGSMSPPKSSEEPHWNNPMPAEAVAAFKKHVDVAVAAFPKASMLWPVSAKDKSGRIEQCAAYLAAFAPDRCMIGSNALKYVDLPPQTPPQWLDAEHNKRVVAYAKKFRMGMEFELISPMASNHPSRSSFPRAGTRDINRCLSQAENLAARAGMKCSDIHVRIYPDDLVKVK